MISVTVETVVRPLLRLSSQILRFSADAVMFDPDLVTDLVEQFGRSGLRCDLNVHNITLLCWAVKNKQGVKLENQPNSTL